MADRTTGGDLGSAAASAVDGHVARLFERLVQGDAAALEDLYDSLSAEVFGLALWRTGSRADAEDVVQELFVRLCERRGRLAGIERPRGFIFAVAHRLAIDVMRRRTRRAEEPIDAALVLPAPNCDDGVTRLDAGRLSARLRELPPAQREALYLHRIAGMTFSEIGRVTGVPTFTAASRCRLALRALKRMLEP